MAVLKQNQIEEYEINSGTMFIRPVEYGSKIYSQIFEEEDEFLSPFKPLDIIKKSCDYFGCDYESRKKGTRQLIGITHKIPIAIEPSNRLYFFPTTSPTRSECIWISHDHVKEHRRISNQQTLITFRNKQAHLFPVPYSTIDNQLLRTSFLRTKLMQRIEFNERKSFYLMQKPVSMEASENTRKYGEDRFTKN
ncbi:competence protein ComK [Neobacillus cucumis]|nr:competence protein ComK [Neobacillus cucumis]